MERPKTFQNHRMARAIAAPDSPMRAKVDGINSHRCPFFAGSGCRGKVARRCCDGAFFQPHALQKCIEHGDCPGCTRFDGCGLPGYGSQVPCTSKAVMYFFNTAWRTSGHGRAHGPKSRPFEGCERISMTEKRGEIVACVRWAKGTPKIGSFGNPDWLHRAG